jgi:hypothetical protein
MSYKKIKLNTTAKTEYLYVKAIDEVNEGLIYSISNKGHARLASNRSRLPRVAFGVWNIPKGKHGWMLVKSDLPMEIGAIKVSFL